MTVVGVLAFSLNLTERIKTYGAYAGFAAIIGLAVLSVLYFAQAREVKRLRAWAGRGPERTAEQNARADAPAPEAKRVVAEPVAKPEPATVAAQSPAPAAGVGAATAAGAGAAVAGVAAATNGESSNGDGNGDEDKPEEAADDEAKAEGDEAKAADASGDDKPADDKPADEKPADDKPADDKPAEDNKRQTSVAMAPIPASQRVRPSTSPRTPRTPTPVAAAASDGGNGNGNGDSEGGHRRLYIAAGVVAGLLAIVIIYALTQSGGGSKSAASNTNQIITTPVATNVSHPTAPARSKVTVVVLNGTTTPLLAKSIGTRLSGGGFQVPESREKNAVDQTHATTIVAYAPGQKAAGLEVAKSLGVGADAVTAIDPDTESEVAASGSAPTVVVTVGADLSH
jgi:hypothetical protein